jgi:superfamily I DNA and/or RNA helicase
MQGREADVVICCFGILGRCTVDKRVRHLYSLPRFNVAVTRAKSLCILVASDAILCPSPAALKHEDTRQGLAHIQAFAAAASASVCPVDVCGL